MPHVRALGICLVAVNRHTSYDETHVESFALWMGDSSSLGKRHMARCVLLRISETTSHIGTGTRGISSSRPLRLRSHCLPTVMRNTLRRDNLCSWLLAAGVLVAWCRHRTTRRKTVMTVNDKWLRALNYAHSDVLTNNHAPHRATVACRVRE